MKKNKKGVELAITTLILIIIGIAVLVGLVIALRGGFSTLKGSTEPLLDSSEASAAVESCNIACDAGNRLTFCCNEFKINDETLKCNDGRLGISCSLSCDDFSCNAKS